jgi:hypothetical protein
LYPRDHTLGTLLHDLSMDQESRRPPPPLAGQNEPGPNGSIDSDVQIRVLDHQDRAHFSHLE